MPNKRIQVLWYNLNNFWHWNSKCKACWFSGFGIFHPSWKIAKKKISNDIYIHVALEKEIRKKFFFFSIITLYTKNVKQIKNTINSAPITIYVVGGKLNVKKYI